MYLDHLSEQITSNKCFPYVHLSPLDRHKKHRTNDKFFHFSDEYGKYTFTDSTITRCEIPFFEPYITQF